MTDATFFLLYTEYMMCVTSVTAEWLAELGGVFYSIRERNVDGLAQARATREFSRKAEIEQEMADQRQQYVVFFFYFSTCGANGILTCARAHPLNPSEWSVNGQKRFKRPLLLLGRLGQG